MSGHKITSEMMIDYSMMVMTIGLVMWAIVVIAMNLYRKWRADMACKKKGKKKR